MPGTTSPDDIVYPLPTDPIAPLNAVFQDMAESVQDALDEKIYLPSTPANKDILVFDGTNWVSRSQAAAGAIPTFADAAARTAAISSPTEGMTSYLDDLNRIEVYTGSAWGAVGTILQVVSTTKTDTFTASLAQGAETAITGLSATITPTATSSKILVISHVSTGEGATLSSIFRAGTNILVGNSAGNRQTVTGGFAHNFGAGIGSNSLTGLDSPNTTSATTYDVRISHSAATTTTVYVNRTSGDSDSTQNGRAVSSITLLEVAG